MITCGGLIFVTGRKEDYLVPFAGGRARQAEVSDPQLVDVHCDADEWPGRQFDHQGAIREIHQERSVRSIGVQREPDVHRFGVERAENLVGNNSDLLIAFEDGRARYGGIEKAIRLRGAREVSIIIGALNGLRRGKSALEGVLAGRAFGNLL